MSRAAFIDALDNDSVLNSLGLDENTNFHNWSQESRPTNDGPFIIIRWGEEDGPIWGSEPERGPRDVAVQVHYPSELTTDFNKVTKVLDRVDKVLVSLRDVVGSDGYTLSFVTIAGRSADITDDGFKTITRYGNYKLYSVETE